MTDWQAGLLWTYGIFTAIVGICGLLATLDSASRGPKAARIFLGFLLPPLGLWFIWRMAFPPAPPRPRATELIEAEREVEETLHRRQGG